jgi:hypothetical protein
LPDTTDLVRESIACGMRHVDAETLNDLEAIMATIDPQPYFPLLDHDGEGGLALQFLTDNDGVRAYYGARHGSYEIVASRHIAAVATDFYSFRESVATLRGVGAIGDVDSSGQIFKVNSAVLFPTGPAGIGGEIVWTRYPFADIVGGTVTPQAPGDGPAHLPNLRLRNADNFEAYLDAWRAGDARAAGVCLADDVQLLRRVAVGDDVSHVRTLGRDESVAALAELYRRQPPAKVEVLNRIITEWYVFADLYVETRRAGGGVDRLRHIALHPLADDGRIRAEMGDVRLAA